MTFVTHPERIKRSQDTKTIMVVIEPETSALTNLFSISQNLYQKGKYTHETIRLAWHVSLEIILDEVVQRLIGHPISTDSPEEIIRRIRSLEQYYIDRGHTAGQTWTIDRRGVLIDGPNEDFIELCLALIFHFSGNSQVHQIFTDIAKHYSDALPSLSTTSINFLENGRYLVYITVNINAIGANP